MKNITIIGCGAVGALYGLRLHTLLGGDHLTFLVDAERKARYEEEGIFINGERAPFRFVTADESEVSDLIIIATKNHHLGAAIAMMAPLVGEHTAILSLLNGIESEGELTRAFGPSHVLYGFCVGLNSTHSANAITYTTEGRIVFGEKDNEKSERVLALKALFERAGIAAVVPKDILVSLYNKFMLNTAYNTISALLDATYGELATEPVWRLRAGMAPRPGGEQRGAGGGQGGGGAPPRLPHRGEPCDRHLPWIGQDLDGPGHGGGTGDGECVVLRYGHQAGHSARHFDAGL